MISLYPRIELQNGARLCGDCLTIHQYVAVYPFNYELPENQPYQGAIWFQYHGGNYTRIDHVPSVWDSNVNVCTMDPITAVILKLVTPEEIKMPAGIEGLLALLR